MIENRKAPPMPPASSGADGGDDQDQAAAEPVRKDAGDRDHQAEEDDAGHLYDEELLARVAELCRAPGEREHRHQIEQHEGRQRHEGAEHQAALVEAEDLGDRNLHALVLVYRLLELRRLGDLQPDIEADGDQEDAGDDLYHL